MMISTLEHVFFELEKFQVFQGLSRKDLERLFSDSQVRVQQHREYAFHAGEKNSYFYIVLSGAYKICKPSSHGDDVIMYFALPGEMLAVLMQLSKDPISVSAIALGPARFLQVPIKNYFEVWSSYPELMLRVQEQLAKRMRHIQSQKSLVKSGIEKKIASLLMELLYRKASTDFCEIPMPLTRKEISESIGVAVESVIRVMSDWSKQGYVETIDQNIRILQPQKLLDILQEDEV